MDPSLCVNGCGFYGSASNKNLCSKCYNDRMKEKIIESQSKGQNSSETNSLKINETFIVPNSRKPCVFGRFTSDLSAAVDDIATTSTTFLEGNKNSEKRRCKSCNKKVGLTGFWCRCGDVFCGRHRYPEVHACVVNFKENGRRALAKENPICISDKIGNRI